MQTSYSLHRNLLLLLATGILLLVLQPVPEGNTLCLFRTISGIPCPACGTGHGLNAILKGDFIAAWNFNPISFLVFIATLFMAPIIVYDVLARKNHLQQTLAFIQKHLHKRNPITWILIVLVLLNWYRTIITLH